MFIKICGTTSEEDALLAVALGADAVGFVFAPSPRQVTAAVVSDIVKRLPDEVLTVGVFRDTDPQRVVDQVLQSGVRAVQLHGTETRKDIEFIRSKLPLTIIKGFSAGSSQVAKAHKYKADIVLLDAPSPGSGQVFDWQLAGDVPDGVRLMIAGGLNPENVADAIAAIQPWGVDVVSGVEASKGRKDPRKLKAFIKNARAAHERAAELARSREAQMEAVSVAEAERAVEHHEAHYEVETEVEQPVSAPSRSTGSALYDWNKEGEHT